MSENVPPPQHQREVRSFLQARDPSIDRRFRPRPKTQVKLFDNVIECDEESELDCGSSVISLDDASKSSISGIDTGDGALVYLRLRPVDKVAKSYTISESGNVLITGPSSECTSTSNNKNTMEKHYSFSTIFDSAVGQCEVFQKCIGQKIEAEENFTVLTYGTSGSGKTFTLLGDEGNPGIIPRSIENIFTLYAANIYPHPSIKLIKARVTIMDDNAMAKETQLRRQILGACPDMHAGYARIQQTICADHAFETVQQDDVSVMIWVSFVEIYNELVYDLLALPSTSAATSMSAPPRENLRIVGNDGKVFIKGLTSVYVKSSIEALKLLRYGLQRVNYAATSINANSSRSHCIFFIDVLKYNRSGLITETSYKFCDLAGSERLNKTGNVGSRLKEAQRINSSLLVLGRCLDAANACNRKKNNEVIPYRESKLTMLLQSALLGKEKLAMIVNVTPTEAYYEENLNVLSFSAIAKNIIFKKPAVTQNSSRYSFFMEPRTNTSAARDEYVEELLQENISLRTALDEAISEKDLIEMREREKWMQQEQDLRNMLVDSHQESSLQNKKQFEQRLQQELDSQRRIYEAKMAALVRKHEEEIEDLNDELEELKERIECGGSEPKKQRRTLD